jgi:hypothetical protein
MVPQFVYKFCDVKFNEIVYASSRDLEPKQYTTQIRHFEI